MKCENCGAQFFSPTGSPVTICSRCLVQGALRQLSEGDKTIATEGESPGERDWGAYTHREDIQAVFPEFELMDRLGVGGMGAVFKARQKSLDRMIAIKILNPKLAEEPEFQERFEREARAMAMLNHPNIVSIHDFGVREGFHFLVMEYIDGCDLQRLIRVGEVDEELAFSVITQTCEALHFAHEHGVVHRDVKPGNIFIGKNGVAKMGDFGIARIVENNADISLTMTGAGMGTPSYMAPEQLADAKTIDARADIYALGVVIYQMLTGKMPAGNFPPPTSSLPRRNKRLDRAVLRAMESDPDARMSDVKDISRALGKIGKSKKPDKGKAEFRILSPGFFVPLLFLMLAIGWFAWSNWRPGVDLARRTVSSTANTKEAAKGNPYENSLGMRFVPVPINGGPSDGKRLLFSIWETRVQDYASFIEGGAARVWPKADFDQKDDHPAVNVNWLDAVAFCEWLTEFDREKGKLGKSEYYRLPSDHEWSCAVGIGKEEEAGVIPMAKDLQIESAYPWGRGYPPSNGTGNYYGEESKGNPYKKRRQIDGYDDSYDRTAPVENFRANEYGLYDMGGNVWEWCEDWLSTQQEQRVVRGSSWFGSIENSLRSSRRGFNPPAVRDNNTGFRVVIANDSDQRSNSSNADVTGKISIEMLLPPVRSGISEEFSAMRRRGGVLRKWSERPDTVDIDPASEMNDLISVNWPHRQGRDWYASRANGETVSVIPTLDQRSDLRKAYDSFSIEWPDRLVPVDSSHKHFLPLLSPVERAIDIAQSHELAIIVTPDGQAKIAAKESWLKTHQFVVNRLKEIENAVSADHFGVLFAVLTSAGTVVCWDENLGLFSPPEDSRRIVQVEAAAIHLMGLYEDGTLVTWAHPKKAKKNWDFEAVLSIPPDLGPIARIDSFNFINAAQRPDGSWFSWGNDKGRGLINQINSIGVALDVEFFIINDVSGAKMLWIEPAGIKDERASPLPPEAPGPAQNSTK